MSCRVGAKTAPAAILKLSPDAHGTNEVNFAILAFFGYQFAPRYKDIRGKMGTLYGFKHPSQYDRESLIKPASVGLPPRTAAS